MLKLVNITKDYVTKGVPTVHALKGLTINFRRNEFVAILGASGCGKTTLLNIIGGLDRYTSGDLIIEGKSTQRIITIEIGILIVTTPSVLFSSPTTSLGINPF